MYRNYNLGFLVITVPLGVCWWATPHTVCYTWLTRRVDTPPGPHVPLPESGTELPLSPLPGRYRTCYRPPRYQEPATQDRYRPHQVLHRTPCCPDSEPPGEVGMDIHLPGLQTCFAVGKWTPHHHWPVIVYILSHNQHHRSTRTLHNRYFETSIFPDYKPVRRRWKWTIRTISTGGQCVCLVLQSAPQVDQDLHNRYFEYIYLPDYKLCVAVGMDTRTILALVYIVYVL